MENNILTIASNSLSLFWGEQVKLEIKDILGGSKRSEVYRCLVKSDSKVLPTTVIIKKYVPQEKETETSASERIKEGLYAEWSGLQFLTNVSKKSIAPKLYIGNEDHSFVMLEDLGRATQLDHILAGNDKDFAEKSLLGLVETLAHMHGLTLQKRELFEKQQEKTFGKIVCEHRNNVWERANQNILLLCEKLEISIPEIVVSQINNTQSFFSFDNPLSAYSHRDPCPDNCLWIEGSVRLIDFERGEFRNAFIDALYGRMHFPTCLCVGAIPKEIYQKMEIQYREILSEYYPDIKNDAVFAESVVTACLWHMAKNIEYVFENDRELGLATTRQRIITRFRCFAEATEEYQYMQETGKFILDIAKKLERKWLIEGFVELKPYCAFRN
jgi:hypothetical protein